MASSSPPSSEYGTLLQGDHGFILAIALTVLVVLALSFITKFYFSWRRINITKKQVGSTDNTVLASDAIWLLSHVRYGPNRLFSCTALIGNCSGLRLRISRRSHIDTRWTDGRRLQTSKQRAEVTSRSCMPTVTYVAEIRADYHRAHRQTRRVRSSFSSRSISVSAPLSASS